MNKKQTEGTLTGKDREIAIGRICEETYGPWGAYPGFYENLDRAMEISKRECTVENIKEVAGVMKAVSDGLYNAIAKIIGYEPDEKAKSHILMLINIWLFEPSDTIISRVVAVWQGVTS